jgi:hypothetical protein
VLVHVLEVDVERPSVAVDVTWRVTTGWPVASRSSRSGALV